MPTKVVGIDDAIKKKIFKVSFDSSTIVAPGNQETILVQPPKGKIWKVRNIRYYVVRPLNSLSGSHRVSIYDNFYNLNDNIQISSLYNQNIHLAYGIPVDFNTYNPNDLQAFIKMWERLTATYSKPILIRYDNNTDVDQTNTRYCTLLVEEFDEVS
jgi:hypothetical protein